ncbi:putative nucleotidyltransferase [Rhizobium leguminosarum]|uniref:Putative nucleotidyltransferase n=1 Tax=Rhizobium leguminosarum TaxID=384 RepID=A0A7Z0DYC2_RHILE|nr:nucleotidyltransferase domain-containing protein [Rhizobium leguminosarum]NYJ11132.1 putative nucleotidyltransferase [Rhizobium leguminosarum]
MQTTALDNLRGSDATRWSNIARAQSLSCAKSAELAQLVGDFLPTDEGSLIVFGSLARGEYTVDSDLDWTILIDGRADSLHLKIVHSLRHKLKEANFKVPGPTEVFGGLVFSHDLVHAIGGDEDTNKNMTRRLLLLLESTAIDANSSREVQKRILNAILSRYVEEDANFIVSNRRKDRIPRFLLNDVVRFWRTMAVDYANKYRARAGDKWALRNIKLRMSRKLIFVSGLFMCISWALRDASDNDDEFIVQKLVAHLRDWTQRPPLESLAMVLEKHAPSLAPDVFDNYDSFLAMLDNREQRELLEKLSPDEAYENELFLKARSIANSFDEALTKLLFDTDEQIAQLVKKYGVF